MAGLPRQPRCRPDRVPVRHATLADAGKPYLRCLEAAPADAEAGRRTAAPLFADRLLLVGGDESVPARAAGALAAPSRVLDDGGGRAQHVVPGRRARSR